MKRLLLLAFALVAGTASAQNLPLWWNGGSGSGASNDVPVATEFDGNGNLYALTVSSFFSTLKKYSNTGAVIWTANFEGSAAGLAFDANGDPVIVGFALVEGTLDMMLTRVTASTGAVDSRTIDNPYGSIGEIGGYSIANDPSDGNLAVATAVRKDGVIRPYVFKFNGQTLTQLWNVGVDTARGAFEHVVVSGNRIYLAGTLWFGGGTILGYIPSEGGPLTTVLPTTDPNSEETIENMMVLNDRLVWSGVSRPIRGGTFDFGQFYGQVDFSAGGGNAYTQFREHVSGTFINDLAYDARTGQFALQTSGLAGNSVRFATLNETTGDFDFGLTVPGSGAGVGLVPVGDGRFASYYQSPPEAPDQVGVTLVDPVLGAISGSLLGPGDSTQGPELTPGFSKRVVASNGRATAVNVGSAVGGRVYSLSYIAGPATDSRRFKEDTSYTFNVLHNDPGVGAKLSYIVSNTAHGTVSLDLNGTAVYTPAPNWYGVDSFVYHLYVNGVFASAETVTYTVLNVNDAPVAVNDEVGTVGTGLVTLPLLNNDVNVDGEASPLRYLSVTQPSNGTVTLANNKTALKIKAAPGQTGQPFSFTYTVQNGTGMTSMATVNGTF